MYYKRDKYERIIIMSNKTKKTSIGGQALIEGIMMKGPDTTAMAVRNASGQIVLEKWETSKKTPVIAKIPILRGIYGRYFG